MRPIPRPPAATRAGAQEAAVSNPTQSRVDVTAPLLLPVSLPRYSMFAVAPPVALWVCARAGGPPAPPRDYYFSPRGSDADGAGTVDRPYGSIQKANQLGLHAGDRLLFEV